MSFTQPVINIGLLGHVANGKSSLVRSITGEKTSRGDSRCMQKNEHREMTIQVGYSNAKIYQCKNCPKPDCYSSIEGSNQTVPACDCCGNVEAMELVQFVSFVDSPGHRLLMRNMISGSAVMDGVILVVDANNKNVPQVQTLEHLTAAEIIGINQYVAIAQNKIDLLLGDPDCQDRLETNHQQIKKFVQDTAAESAPIIPTCFSPSRQINLKLILQYLAERAKPNPHPAYKAYPLFIHCVRSFDINKPCPGSGLKGGVIGGTIMNGVLRIGDLIEIRPGYKMENGTYRPLYTKVVSLYTGTTSLEEARPGGLIGIGTTLDPSVTRSDLMVGMCAGIPDKLPAVATNLDLNVQLLKTGLGHESKSGTKVEKLVIGDIIQLAVGSATVHAKLIKRSKGIYNFQTDAPVCPVPGQAMPMSKAIDNTWTIIGRAYLAGTFGGDPLCADSDLSESYTDILTETLQNAFVPSTNAKLKIQQPNLYKDGGAKLVWSNFAATCKALDREPEHLQHFFAEELSATVTVGGADGQMIIHGKGRYRQAQIQSILVKYISEFVTCPMCKATTTTLMRTKKTKHVQLLCKGCGAEHLR